jgi:hypothetical protein
MAKTKLTVTTDAGTFTRTTTRTYSHIVVVKGERHELLQAERLAGIAQCLKYAAEYEKTVATGVSRDDRTDWHREQTAKNIADGSYAKWIASYRAEAAELAARAPITADAGDTFGILGWCGRLDLAGKLAATDQASRYREVRIYALDGTRVR